VLPIDTPLLDAEAVDDLEDAPDAESESAEEKILDQATAARTLIELKAEIQTLIRLEGLALAVRRGGNDTKWQELAGLLGEIFTPAAVRGVAEAGVPYDGEEPSFVPSPHQKLVIFTEHRDTLSYLQDRITTLLGQPEAVVLIHGGTAREERQAIQERFRHDPTVQVLLATDAAGEGINLQRAHLMVNYDLPWNPNRLEQRFGRIHRIGQTEVCHLWNLVADETREGDVYRRLLEKLEQARQSLGGQVFDVLGQLQFQGKPLRELLMEAVRYGDRPDVRARLTTVVDAALDREHLRDLMGDHALVQNVMDARKVMAIREEMERADARRLQPHYVASFFEEAFRQLGGSMRPREARRFEITHVPATVRNRDRQMGVGAPVVSRYERVTFEKQLAASPGAGQPAAEFLSPGHPLLDAVIDLTLERHRDLLKQGTVLVDERDEGMTPRVLFTLDHAIQDATTTRAGTPRTISRQLLYVEQQADGSTRHLQYAPYLDYRPLAADEPDIAAVLARPECAWVDRSLEQQALNYAVAEVVPLHIREVRAPRLELIAKTRAAVHERLTKEIMYWDQRAETLKDQEQAGKTNARVNAQEARRRADDLQARLRKRMDELKLEEQITALPPVVLGAVLVAPIGLLRAMQGKPLTMRLAVDTQAAAAAARAEVMRIERELGNEPIDREFDKLGYDIESRDPRTEELRFIEVKGRRADAETITVTRNEVLYSLNNPERYILAVVEFHGLEPRVHYVRSPFHREPDFGVTSVNYDLREMLGKAETPR
ncbi:MAG: DUF3883 domain-containing protein, partial [Chloroflexota bacterium]|nr:DUF3883 domain-containing protein [Chloroflexota bacterium]